MSIENEKTSVLVEHNCWLNPNALSVLLGGRDYRLAEFRDNEANLLYYVDRDQFTKLWNMDFCFVKPHEEEEPGVFREISTVDKLFSNMTTQQKDYVLQTVEMDYVRSTLYQLPEHTINWAVRRVQQSAFNQRYGAQPKEQPFMLPNIMTTKAAFYPMHNLPKEERKPDTCHELSKEHFGIHPLLHDPQHIQPEVWESVYKNIRNKEFYPTQFIAYKHYGVLSEDKKAFLDSDISARMRKNPKLFKDSDWLPTQDMWMIFALQPYSLNYMTCAVDMHAAKTILGELEKEFIQPHYESDGRLRMVDDTLSKLPGTDPSNYKSFSDETITRYYSQLYGRSPS